MARLVLAVFVAAVAVIAGAQDSQKACNSLAKCMTDAVNQRKRCDSLGDLIRQIWPPKWTDLQRRHFNLSVEVATLDYAKRNSKIDCLKNTLASTVLVSCDKKRTAECDGIASGYSFQSQLEADNVFEAERKKREDAAKAARAAADDAAAKLKAANLAANAAEKDFRDYVNNRSRDCWAEASLIDSKCGVVGGCCSESWICDLQILQTDASQQYATKQKDYQLEQRVMYPPSCPAPAPPPTVASLLSTPGASGTQGTTPGGTPNQPGTTPTPAATQGGTPKEGKPPGA